MFRRKPVLPETARFGADESARRAVWKSKSLLLALAVTVFGAVSWMSTSTVPEPATTPTNGASLFETSTASTTGQSSVSGSSALTRFGGSYAAGFLIGWAFRRFLKWSLVGGVVVLGIIALARKLGWFELDWALVESQIRHGLDWLKGEAGALREFLTGYIPSAGAGLVGAFFGVRYR